MVLEVRAQCLAGRRNVCAERSGCVTRKDCVVLVVVVVAKKARAAGASFFWQFNDMLRITHRRSKDEDADL